MRRLQRRSQKQVKMARTLGFPKFLIGCGELLEAMQKWMRWTEKKRAKHHADIDLNSR